MSKVPTEFESELHKLLATYAELVTIGVQGSSDGDVIESAHAAFDGMIQRFLEKWDRGALGESEATGLREAISFAKERSVDGDV